MSVWFQHIIDVLGEKETTKELPISTLFDGIYLPNHHLLLHFVSIEKVASNNIAESYFSDMSNAAQLQQVKCIHIWEDVWQQHPTLINARILALIGNRQRIHARATMSKRIDKKTADTFLNNHHLQYAVNAYYKFGLYHKEELVAVATFSKSRIMNDGIVPYRSYELIRFASKCGVTVTGGLSKLLQLFINEVHPAHIMTYADRDWSNGEGYHKLGFVLKEQIPPQIFYINPINLQRFSAQQLGNDSAENYLRVTNAGSLKFVLDRRT